MDGGVDMLRRRYRVSCVNDNFVQRTVPVWGSTMYLENIIGGLPYPLRVVFYEFSHPLGMLLALFVVFLVINPSGRREGRQDRKASVHGSPSRYGEKCWWAKRLTTEGKRLIAVALMDFNGSVELEKAS